MISKIIEIIEMLLAIWYEIEKGVPIARFFVFSSAHCYIMNGGASWLLYNVCGFNFPANSLLTNVIKRSEHLAQRTLLHADYFLK